MPALVLENGTGVVGANSYVDVVYADHYFEHHPFHTDAWNALDSLLQANLLVAASRQLDILFNWFGYRTYNEQELGFPRQHLMLKDRSEYLSNNVIPTRLKEATCEMAFFMSRGDAFAPSSSEGLESLRIDVIELNFSSSTKAAPLPAPALTLLRGLGEYAFGRRVRRVLVG